MRKITKIKAHKWSGKYIPAFWRVDEYDINGVYMRKIGIFDTLKEAQENANND